MGRHTGDLGRWRDGGSQEDWPSPWPSYSQHWPRIPDIWQPEHSGGLTVCIRGPEVPPQIIRWDSASDALLAAALLFTEPCGPRCIRRHNVLWSDETGLHVRPVRGDPAPPSLADQLRELYPRHLNGSRFTNEPRLWPMPIRLNQRMTRGARQ